MRTFSTAFSPALLWIFFSVVLLSSCGTGAFFYYPTKGQTTTPKASKIEFESIKVASHKGRILDGWILKPKTDSILGTVLHFHGNGANISNQYKAVVPLVESGFRVIVFDYEGYGLSEGKAKQERVLADGLAMLDYASDLPTVQGKPLILFGQSLGGHLAVVVAAQRQDKLSALITEGAFTGHEEIAVYTGKMSFKFVPKFFIKWMVPTRYDAIEVMDQIAIPKVIIHSTEDAVIPYSMGQALFGKAQEPKRLWTIKGEHISASRDYPDDFVKCFKDILK